MSRAHNTACVCRAHNTAQGSAFCSGDRTSHCPIGRLLTIPLDQTVIGSNDSLVERNRQEPSDRAVWGSIPAAESIMILSCIRNYESEVQLESVSLISLGKVRCFTQSLSCRSLRCQGSGIKHPTHGLYRANLHLGVWALQAILYLLFNWKPINLHAVTIHKRPRRKLRPTRTQSHDGFAPRFEPHIARSGGS